MKSIKFFLLLTLMSFFFSACQRDELCFLHSGGAKIRIVAQYDDALVPDKSYVAIYNFGDGSLVREELMKTPFQHEIDLNIGSYYIMVYNEPFIEGSFTTAHTVSFSDKTHWNNVVAFAVTDQSATYTPDNNTRAVVNIQEQLAIGRMQIDVTPDMIGNNHIHPTPISDKYLYVEPDITLQFYPKRVFTKVNIEVKAINYKGWILRRSNGNRPVFVGASNHYFMGSGSYSEVPSSQYVSFLNGGNFYDENSYTHFYSTFYTVGLQSGRLPAIENNDLYTLFLRFEHGSPETSAGIEIRPITVDLISGANAQSVTMTQTSAGQPHPSDGKVYYNDVLDIEVTVLLPERIPIGNDTEIDLEDWEEEDVPLDAPPSLYFHPNGAEGSIFWWRHPIGTMLFLPQPTDFVSPVGYGFKEWNTRNDGTGIGYQPGTSYLMPRGGITLFSIWEKRGDMN